VILPAAARVGVAVGVGVGLGHALGLGHAYWVGLTAAAVLQGSNVAVTRRRVVHRVVGTVIGVGLAFALLGWGPPIWLVVVVAIVSQGLVELVIAAHYGVAVVPITVLALMLFHLGAPGEDLGGAVAARLVDTGIGAALALVLRLTLWPWATSVRLSRVQARVVRTVRRVLGAAWDGGGTGALAGERRLLQAELVALRTVHSDTLADSAAASRSGDGRWPISVAVEELSVLALSWPPHRTPPASTDAEEFLHHLDELAEAVAGGDLPASAVPPLPGLPRTAAAARALAVAVRDAAASDGRGDHEVHMPP
jgi:hypothetical protein